MTEQTVSQEEVQDLFAKAWHDLKTNGWFQGDYFPERDWDSFEQLPQDCPSCALGALFRATGQTFHQACSNPVLDLADIQLGQKIGNALVSSWNDQEGRTEAEVLATFEELAGPEAIHRLQHGS